MKEAENTQLQENIRKVEEELKKKTTELSVSVILVYFHFLSLKVFEF